MKEAAAISVVQKSGDPVRLELLDEAGQVFGVAVMKPHTFERIWDKLGEAVALGDMAGIAPSRETFEL